MIRLGTAYPLALALSLLGCEKTPEPQASPSPPPAPAPAPPPASPSAATSSAASASAPADIAYDVPKGWEVMPNTNQMRKATIKVPRQAGDTDDAELTFTTAGGTKDANVARWCNQLGQTEPSKREERTVNGMSVTIVEVKGAYAGMGGGPKKDNFMLLGAIVPAAEKQLFFFKMTGPEKTVTASRKDFDAFVGSFRAK